MADTKKRTILCVDDEVDIIDTLHDTFMDHYNVKTAKDGKEGLQIFNESEIDLVISDQRMPEMTGSELLAEINKVKPICKKILLTGYADIDAAIDAINKGSVDKYFNKPWDEDELLKSVEDLLEELKTDEFFEKALQETKQFKENADSLKQSANLYSEFLNNYFGGVCLVSKDEKIEYANKKALEKLKCNSLDDIKGKSFTDIFAIKESDREEMKKKYNDNVSYPSKIDVKLYDGQNASVQGWISFAPLSNMDLSGIIFFD